MKIRKNAIIGVFLAVGIQMVLIAPTYATTPIHMVSVDSYGVQGSSETLGNISANGRYVVFSSYASNLVANDLNDTSDVFRHDNQTGETVIVSVASDGTQGDAGSYYPSISDDGNYVVFCQIH